jgi:DNA-binding transcriptional regulator YiaG
MARVLPITTSAGYVASGPRYLIVGQILAGAGTTTVEDFRAVAPPQTTSGARAAGAPSEARALSELRRLSGLSWEQLARILGVTRRTLHFWASGKAMARSNEEHLQRVLAVVRSIDHGATAANRSVLLESLEDRMNAVDLLAVRDYERAASVTARLSAMARASRAPSAPEALVGALHDRVHQDVGPSRPARSVRIDHRK